MLLKKVKNRKGFTLIELIVVVAIFLIFCAVLIPAIMALHSMGDHGKSTMEIITQEQEEKFNEVTNETVPEIKTEVKEITPKTKGVNKKL